MSEELDIIQFLSLSRQTPVIDVRSPAEYQKGRIPGALNIPLFSNEERAKVGTSYVQKNREEAYLLGLEIAGPKLKMFANEALKIALEKKLLVHCWRGGMRSKSMAWLFDQMGIKTYTLKGGYKAYRRFVLEWFNKPPRLIVLGGMTSSGKTEILHELKKLGQQVLDLEGIAHHRGSAFGGLGKVEQPTQEQFENQLFTILQSFDYEDIIWVEDESISIGRTQLPKQWYQYMQQSPAIFLLCDKVVRVKRLVKEYAVFPSDLLAESIRKINKRLGGDNTKLALEALAKGDYCKVADITLQYYDKAYLNQIKCKPQENIIQFSPKSDASNEIAREILRYR
jgi:tRNA 2-selenouridine synthase